MTSVKTLLYPTYIFMIRNSVGTMMFREYYAEINNVKKEILRQGDLACAYYVSAILRIFDLTEKVRTTVLDTARDLENAGWYKIDKPKVGSILVWKAKKFKNQEVHRHIGFYLGDKNAISNNADLGFPEIHHYTFGETKSGKAKRPVEVIYWNKKLEN